MNINKDIIKEFNILKQFSTKRGLIKYLNTLTFNDIDNKNIVLTVGTQAPLFISPDSLKNELTVNNIVIQKVNYKDSFIKINRKNYTLADVKLAKRSVTINRVKKKIETDKEIEEKLNQLYKLLDIDLRIHSKKAISDINKLATYIINTKK